MRNKIGLIGVPTICMSIDYAEGILAVAGAAPEKERAEYEVRLPQKAYTLRCTGVEFKKSALKDDGKGGTKGGHPMLERSYEIAAPEKIKVKDGDGTKEVVVQGIKLKDWLVITAKTKDFVEKDCRVFKCDMPDDERPVINQYIGKEVKALLRSVVTNVVDEETKEPIMAGGKPIVRYQHSIVELLED